MVCPFIRKTLRSIETYCRMAGLSFLRVGKSRSFSGAWDMRSNRWLLIWFLVVTLWAQLLASTIVYTTLVHGPLPLSLLAIRLMTWFALPVAATFVLGLTLSAITRRLNRQVAPG
jgi:hypothetical protein